MALSLAIGERGRPQGLVVMGEKEDREMYFPEDVEVFRTLLNQVSLAIENIQHIEEAVKEQSEKERLRKEMEMARQIQENLLPKGSPETGGFRVEGMLIPAAEVSGDYYDFIVYSQERVGVVVGDVSGKGLDAGMVMSMVKSTIVLLTERGLSPCEVVIGLNRHLCGQLKQQKFVSLIYGEYSSEDNIFRWAGAGQEHVVVKRRDGDVEVIRTGGIILGMVEDIGDSIREQEVKLEEGDKILLYSDGVTELRDSNGEMYGMERLVEVVKEIDAGEGVRGFLNKIREELEKFKGEASQYDDITLVVLGRE